MQKTILPALIVALATSALPIHADDSEHSMAEIISTLSQGKAELISELPPHAGLTPFLVRNKERGHQFVVYRTADQAHIVTGRVFTPDGEDLTAPLIPKDARKPSQTPADLLGEVENTDWVEQGVSGPLLYAVADTNCGYCRRLHEAVTPLVAQGALRVRWVMVDTLRHDGTAGKVLTAAKTGNGAGALRAAMSGDTSTLDRLAGGVADRDGLERNQGFLRRHGVNGTPYLIWQTASGSVQAQAGMPRDIRMITATLPKEGTGNDDDA